MPPPPAQYVLDTHAFLWMLMDAPELSFAARQILQDPQTDLSVSILSFWEIGIKASIGKLPLPFSLPQLEMVAREQDIMILPITVAAVALVQRLPFHHKDPFDRLLAATALTEQRTLLSADPIFDLYGVSRLW